MAKTIKLPSIRLFELSTTLDDILPKELVSLKEIRLASAIVSEMQAACKDYTDKMGEYRAAQMKVFNDRVNKLNEETKEMAKEDKDRLTRELADELNKTFQKGLNEIQEKEGGAECELELSDEKFSKTQELFKKFSIQKYTNKQVLLEIADLLEVED